MTFQRSATAEATSPPAKLPVASNGPSSTSAVQTIDRLVFAPAAEAWPDGAAPLIRWLRANPDALGELLGTTFTVTSDELPGIDGTLLLGRDGERVLVIVELAESSEQHFGSLLTNMTATKATGGVWVVGSARNEHLAAMSWLNRATDASFYVVRLRAARIGASHAAPVFEVIVRRPRGSDGTAAVISEAIEAGRRAGDWREVALGEVAATTD